MPVVLADFGEKQDRRLHTLDDCRTVGCRIAGDCRTGMGKLDMIFGKEVAAGHKTGEN